MALPENRNAVVAILAELEPMILGKERGGITCSCGAIHSGAARAVAIIPGGDSYPGQEINWFAWMVRMQEHDCANQWECTLDFFIKTEKIKEIFSRHFGFLPPQKQVSNPYRLLVRDMNRVKAGLPAAVRIRENENQIRFSFDWGADQAVAHELYQTVMSEKIEREKLTAIIALLQLLNPQTYLGGPKPQLPFESTWHLDYNDALYRVQQGCSRVFFQNIGMRYEGGSEIIVHADVVFVKSQSR